MKIWIAKDNTSAALTTIFTGSKPVLDGEAKKVEIFTTNKIE